MASGTLPILIGDPRSYGFKFFLFAGNDNSTEMYLLQIIIMQLTGEVSLTFKTTSTRPRATTDIIQTISASLCTLGIL